MTGAGKAQGTAHYMSPEQINLDPSIDHRTDIFSLGAVMYEILCGQTPAKGEKLHQVLDSVKNDQPPAPSSVTTQRVPRVLEELTMRCLEKNPRDRYDSMSEIILQLQQEWRWDLAPDS